VARDIYSGTAAASGAFSVGAGRLRALLVSHGETAAQTVTFHDTADYDLDPGTVVLELILPAGISPTYLRFPQGDDIRFAAGLHIIGADHCALSVWATVSGT
jgi:hypothetical protein